MALVESERDSIPSGAALAACLAAGVGAFAMGLVVILGEAGLFAAPALYAPAGGVSGRTTLAVVVWLVAWALLHHRWKGRQVEARRPLVVSLILIGAGILLAFPPAWALL